jgi:O-antigen/teichoic acid export membrane protein
VGYFKNVLRGVAWMSAFRLSTRLIAYIKIAVLARLLLPSQFGIYGIASLLLAFLETLTETGISIFFIQGQGKLKDYVDTAWVVSILRGIIISAVIFLTAPYIAGFFHEPASVNVIYLMASVPLFRAFINPSEIRFRLELNFRKEFLYRTVIFLVDAIVAVSVAYQLRSAVSLVYGMAVGAVFEVVMSFIIFKPFPKLKASLEKARKILGRGKWVSVSRTTGLAFSEGDDVFVGRMLDTASLGIYQVAYKISTLPFTEVGQVVNSVTFPVYSKFAHDRKRLKRAFLRIVGVVFIVVFPIGVIFYLFPGQIIGIILGPNWLEAIPVLKALALFGVLRAVSSVTNSLYLSVKKQEYAAYVSSVSFMGMAVGIIPFINAYGVVGAAYSAIVGLVMGLILDILLTNKILLGK